jgi:hypothetical protein
MVRPMLEILAGTALLRHVVQYEDEVCFGTSAVTNRPGNRKHPYLLIVLAANAKRGVGLLTALHRCL